MALTCASNGFLKGSLALEFHLPYGDFYAIRLAGFYRYSHCGGSSIASNGNPHPYQGDTIELNEVMAALDEVIFTRTRLRNKLEKFGEVYNLSSSSINIIPNFPSKVKYFNCRHHLNLKRL